MANSTSLTMFVIQTIVKKLNTASLQIEKSKVQSSRFAKQKNKSVNVIELVGQYRVTADWLP
jgi:hypothetical protein